MASSSKMKTNSRSDELENILSDFLERGYEDIPVFENPEYVEAIQGISVDGRVVYRYRDMVKSLMDSDGISEEEAIEFIDYNTIRTLPYMGEKAPVVYYDRETH